MRGFYKNRRVFTTRESTADGSCPWNIDEASAPRPVWCWLGWRLSSVAAVIRLEPLNIMVATPPRRAGLAT
jgi:hypothetical protein